MFTELTEIIMNISIELWEFLMTLVIILVSIGSAAGILKSMTGSVLGGSGMAGTAILGIAGLIGLAMGVFVIVPAIAEMIQKLRPAAPFSFFPGSGDFMLLAGLFFGVRDMKRNVRHALPE